MRNSSTIMLLLAVLVGAATVWMVRNFLEARPDTELVASATPVVEVVKVVVATHPLSFGDTLHKDLLREVDWPKDAAPLGSFNSVNEILDGDERRVVLRAMEINELVLKSRVSGFGGKATLSQVITPGLRATAIRVDDVVGVGGFVLPGDRVDILLTRPQGKGRDNLITDVLIQNVRVLAVDQLASERADSPVVAKAATVEVTPRQAQKLSLAARVGSLTLSLRNLINGAADPVMMRTIRVSDLGPGISRPKKKSRKSVRRPSTSSTIKIVRGLVAKSQSVKKEKMALPSSIQRPVGATTSKPMIIAPAPLKSSNPSEPVAMGGRDADAGVYAQGQQTTVTIADLDRSFRAAEERFASDSPMPIMKSNSQTE